MKTRFMLIACLVFMISGQVFSQHENDHKSKAEYVISLITDNNIASVRISTPNCHRAYSIDWLARISVKEGFLVFSKGNVSNAWDIEKAIAIDKIDDMIVIRLPENIGLDWF
jgi:hypothetical protein